MLSFRRNSASSTSSTSSSRLSQDSASVSSTFDDLFFPLEPIEGSLPHEVVEVHPPKRARGHSHTAPLCSLEKAGSFNFSRRLNTEQKICPRHGIRHSAHLALPARDSRSFESECSQRSRARSLKCSLKRISSWHHR
ncbi:hypothetical protein JCM1840_007602 [Sporobolomyces johnsonii]